MINKILLEEGLQKIESINRNIPFQFELLNFECKSHLFLKTNKYPTFGDVGREWVDFRYCDDGVCKSHRISLFLNYPNETFYELKYWKKDGNRCVNKTFRSEYELVEFLNSPKFLYI
jgi:hypothetical protein